MRRLRRGSSIPDTIEYQVYDHIGGVEIGYRQSPPAHPPDAYCIDEQQNAESWAKDGVSDSVRFRAEEDEASVRIQVEGLEEIRDRQQREQKRERGEHRTPRRFHRC